MKTLYLIVNIPYLFYMSPDHSYHTSLQNNHFTFVWVPVKKSFVLQNRFSCSEAASGAPSPQIFVPEILSSSVTLG